MMGGPQGHHPGRVVEFDRKLRMVAEHPAQPPDDGFNPHGISVRPELNLMVTSDFICPSTTLHAVPGGLDLRGSIRVWELSSRGRPSAPLRALAEKIGLSVAKSQ